MATPFAFEIVTPDKMLYSTEEATYVGFTAPSGGMGIEARHLPVTATLSVAPIKVNLVDGTVKYFAVCGGFLEMNGTKCTVLATIAEDGMTVDEARAEAARKRAEERLASKAAEIDFDRAAAALQRALMRLKAHKLATGK
ncbi:MAG: ATP synthase F1 subunit epsilon [Acidaminococcaceae bacterium]|nr:ATP synthase F1 subunit epsilon [Acidaminococcaceae bacterium]